MGTESPTSPAEFCKGLLSALEASDGRRARRKRDTRADTIGLDIKRRILQAAVEQQPRANAFEAWLVQQCRPAGVADGGIRAMALSIWDEWQLYAVSGEFRSWIDSGAYSEDRLGAREA